MSLAALPLGSGAVAGDRAGAALRFCLGGAAASCTDGLAGACIAAGVAGADAAAGVAGAGAGIAGLLGGAGRAAVAAAILWILQSSTLTLVEGLAFAASLNLFARSCCPAS